MGNKITWEDILPEEEYCHSEFCICPSCFITKIRNKAIESCRLSLRQAEKEGKVALNPPDVVEIKEILDKTGKEIGCIKPSSIRMDKYATAISDSLRKGDNVDLNEACSKIRKEFVLNTEYDKVVAILLEFCESVLKAKGMPELYPETESCSNKKDTAEYMRGFRQGQMRKHNEWLFYHSKIMSRISIDSLTVRIGYELSKNNVQPKPYFAEELATAIVAGLKEER